MDLGCMDLGCIEKKRDDPAIFLDSDTTTGSPKISKQNKAIKDAALPNLSILNKFTSQIKKPPHRKTSPLNWFPRKKVDSYLKRKIKLLQEVGGMNSTLDETLGDANPHYSKVLKEKMAVREAAQKAMETRKAAMVEASWCRILKAARIQSKDAEVLLSEVTKTATEAFEAAIAIGVVMYDMPDCPRRQYEIETSLDNGERFTTHTVTASFESAFEVDKQVSAAVKAAFIKLASCPSINKQEFKELLEKISQNPVTGCEDSQDATDLPSECESDTGSELGSAVHKDNSTDIKTIKYKMKQSSEKFNMTKLEDLMLERLKHLQEEELASLATIVATCGLGAALAEAENDPHPPGLGSLTDHQSSSSIHNNSRRMSSFGVRSRYSNAGGQLRNTNTEPELPSLDKFLVKRLTKLERDVQEAKDARIKESKNRSGEISRRSNAESDIGYINLVETVSDLGSVLVKHSSKIEKEIEEAKRTGINPYEVKVKKMNRFQNRARQDVQEEDVPLDECLVKHVSKFEREVQEAKNRRNFEPPIAEDSVTEAEEVDKENVDLNKKGGEEVETTIDGKSKSKEIEEEYRSLDKVLVKPVHRLEREKMQGSTLANNEYEPQHHQKRRKEVNNVTGEWGESLDKVLLVKHVSRLEKEKIEQQGSKEAPLVTKGKRREFDNSRSEEGSLDQVLVKYKSRLEIGGFGQQQVVVLSRQKARRERELQEAWGGLSLGNSMRPHHSRLERDKAAWLKAERRGEEAMASSN